MNTAVWFEIPVSDLARATTFYKKVFEYQMDMVEVGPVKMSVFRSDGGAESVNGALILGPNYEPSKAGTVVYLNGGKDLTAALARVVPAGGEIYQEKTSLGEHGFCAFFIDSEGNRVGMHSKT